MKKYIYIFICFYLVNSYSQKKDTIYFFINKKDTLIKKQIAISKNDYEGYEIFYTQKKKVIVNNTPVIDGKIWGENNKYNHEVLKDVSVSFNFYRREDKIINKKDIENLHIIKKREDFLKLKKDSYNFDMLGFVYYFIEPTECPNKYVKRKVYPITYE